MPCCELMKAHVILLIGEQRERTRERARGRERERGRERQRERGRGRAMGGEGEERDTQSLAFDAEHLFAELSVLLQAPYPQSQAARAPAILLYFEELREVARRQRWATGYYITADKIERAERETHTDREEGSEI